jgi:hypothetical protein
VVVSAGACNVEIQVRTSLQHRWAELSEKLADQHGIELKYGGGEEPLRQRLMKWSDIVRAIETLELQMLDMNFAQDSDPGRVTPTGKAFLELQNELRAARRDLDDIMGRAAIDIRKFI